MDREWRGMEEKKGTFATSSINHNQIITARVNKKLLNCEKFFNINSRA
jgi:hypothetical protein